ncbi:MAG: LysM peptidoglycan-binding domain-containing protein, partial [Gammaproteobacteria bacterium]|nr:LysM peptidoglycan-binding domain-containing protein [Gammaproteobacteria bacterium]
MPSTPAQRQRRAADEFETHTFAVAEDQSVVGTLLSMPIGPGETLSDVARHFGLGYEEIAQANPDIDPWVPAANAEVLIPQLFVLPRAARRGIVINLAAMRLFRFKSGENGTQVTTYPVGIGREGKSTPTGTMAIARKTKGPAWYPTKNILADHAKRGDPLPAMVPPGPDNPLGAYAMYLTRPSYLIHGTNKPFSVGLRASNGCIRMYPENIEPLFGAAALREPVQIVNQPYVYGWRGNVLYLQAYTPHEELNPGALRSAVEADLKAIQDAKHHPLDWERIGQVLREARGIPMPVSQGSPSFQVFLASAVPVAHPGVLFGRPALPADDGGGWRVFAADTASEITARRVTAVLNHQGPPIPAKAIEVGERYQVIAGPFPDAKAAKLAAHRIRADLELDPRVLAPDDQIAGHALPSAVPAEPFAEPAARTERAVPAASPSPVLPSALAEPLPASMPAEEPVGEPRPEVPAPSEEPARALPNPAAYPETLPAEPDSVRTFERAGPETEPESVPETPVESMPEATAESASQSESEPVPHDLPAAPNPYDATAWPESAEEE